MAEKANNSHPSKRGNAWWNNRFYTILIAVALIGGGCAFFIPLFITSYGPGDNVPGLRQTFLAITGGTLAILTLWETRRKNDQEHMRQVHAERRSRYATAIEQLANEKAPIRLGGVYTLVKLIDEWLADEKTLPNEEERREEGQVIIDSLCAYIRSSFDLALKAEVLSHDETPENYEGGAQQFVKDQERFHEEKEIRLTILSNFKERLGTIIEHKDKPPERHKGTWSDFNYNFSTTVFFYPIDFSNNYFSHLVNFDGSTFTKKAIFKRTKFDTEDNEASNLIFNLDDVEFSWNMWDMSRSYGPFNGTIFIEDAIFDGAEFENMACFVDSIFKKRASFFLTDFTVAIFSKATFNGPVNFWPRFTDSIFSYLLKLMFKDALFSNKVDPNDYIFNDVNQKINTVEIEEESGTVFTIPKYASLFSPETPTKKEKVDISLVSSLVKRGRGFIAHILEARNTL